MQKTLRNTGGEVVHDFTLNVTVRYKGGGGCHFSPFFALRNISMAPYYLIQSYLLKYNLHLRHSCFPGKFMNFSEAATGCVL